MFLCNPEAVRPAVGFENWTPSPEDIADLRKAEEAIRRNDIIDITDQRRPADEPMEPEVRMDHTALDPVSGAPVVSGPPVETPAESGPRVETGPPTVPEPPTRSDDQRVHEGHGIVEPPRATPLDNPNEPMATVPAIEVPEPTPPLGVHSPSSASPHYAPISPRLDRLLESVTQETPTMEQSLSPDHLLDASTIHPEDSSRHSPGQPALLPPPLLPRHQSQPGFP